MTSATYTAKRGADVSAGCELYTCAEAVTDAAELLPGGLATGWTSYANGGNGTSSYSNGTLTIAQGSSSATFGRYRAITTTSGNYYLVTIKKTTASNTGSARLGAWSAVPSSATPDIAYIDTTSNAQMMQLGFTATGSTTYISIANGGATYESMTFTSITCKPATITTASEKVTNGDGSSTTGWTGSGATLSISGGKLRVTNSGAANGYAWQRLTLTTGKKYVLRATFTTGTAGAAPNWGVVLDGAVGVTGGALTSNVESALYFTASKDAYIYFYVGDTTSGHYTDWDNIIVRECADAIDSNAKFPMLYGSLVRAPVASYATTTAWYGFSASNGLKLLQHGAMPFQPGTADFYCGAWITGAYRSGSYQTILSFGDYFSGNWVGNGGFLLYTTPNGTAKFYITDDNFSNSDSVESVSLINDGQTHFVFVTKASGVAYIYIDGALENSFTLVQALSTISNSGGSIIAGSQQSDTYPFSIGGIALARVGEGTLTATDVLNIYNNEKHLFIERNKFTVVGNSYSVDIPAVSNARSREVVRSVKTSIGGRSESTYQRADTSFSVSTAPMSIPDYVELRGFLDNVDNYESFQFAQTGTAGAESQTYSCVLTSETESESQVNGAYQSTSFTVKVE